MRGLEKRVEMQFETPRVFVTFKGKRCSRDPGFDVSFRGLPCPIFQVAFLMVCWCSGTGVPTIGPHDAADLNAFSIQVKYGTDIV